MMKLKNNSDYQFPQQEHQYSTQLSLPSLHDCQPQTAETVCVASAESKLFTYGCELEWSDIDRTIDIPAELGSWEGPKVCGYYICPEIDIVNTQGQWRGVGTDPLCQTCKVGGEIHTVPSPDVESQLLRILRLMDIFPRLNVACPNHGHIHVKIPGIKTDLSVLKNVFAYLEKNEDYLINACCGMTRSEYEAIINSDLADTTKRYLIIGDGKHIHPDLYAAIASSTTIEEAMEYIRTIPCLDWDCFSNTYYETTTSHRTAVNMYNLIKGDTIEFRIFRASLNPFEIYSSLKFVEVVVHEAVLGTSGMSVNDIIDQRHFEFPKINYDYDLALGWETTRQTKGRCGPFKKSFASSDAISSDPIIVSGETNDFDNGISAILDMCRDYWNNTKN